MPKMKNTSIFQLRKSAQKQKEMQFLDGIAFFCFQALLFNPSVEISADDPRFSFLAPVLVFPAFLYPHIIHLRNHFTKRKSRHSLECLL